MNKTPLYDEHLKLGARMIPFGGFDMPVQYKSILAEHEAVRKRAALFDLSHMAQFIVQGDGAAEWIDRMTVNAVPTMKPWQARYNIFTNEHGGAHDDVIVYRLDDAWMIVANASNADKIWELLNAQAAPGIKLHSRHGKNALIAIQGRSSVAMLQPHTHADLNALKYYFCTRGNVFGSEAVIARTGYTGEDGFELFVDGRDASEIWNGMLSANQAGGLIAAGLGARDVLRLEAGMPLYGHELSEEISPLQAGLQWAIKFNKPEFTGKEALQAQQESDTYRRIVGIVMDGRAPAREGYAVFLGERRVGEIRSGSIAPSVENKSIATALVEKDAATAGTDVVVHIRGTAYGAKVTQMPFYKRSYEIGAA